VGIGFLGAVGVYVLVSVAIVAIASTRTQGFHPDDIGDPLQKANAVAHYAVERLSAAQENVSLPQPPRILADQGALQIGLMATLASQVLTFSVVGFCCRQDFRGLVKSVGLDRPNLGGIWLPLVLAPAAAIFVILYTVTVEKLGIWFLEPQSTVPNAIVRNDFTLSIAAVVTLIGAPISEELFFRGFVYSGLTKWGLWPAACVSAMAFAAVHFDPGSLPPFFVIALCLVLVYQRSGSLWHSIALHAAFNSISFFFLVGLS
jgi:membrane protease YdiL (CAAX protease family)